MDLWNSLIINPMVNILLFTYSLIGETGLTIIVFTILIRLVTHPLTVQQMRSTQALQELQQSKEWLDIQKKYKEDKQKLQMEQAKLLQAKKINPLGSCLPLLIQFPIIIGLYTALRMALAATPLELLSLSKHIYPFVKASTIIPLKSHFLWMNLSQPERLMVFGVGIPTLAILVVASQYMQGKLMTPMSNNPGDQSAQMGKMMNLYMPLFMGWITYTLSSGLGIYFLATNLVTIAQYAAMGKLDWKNLLPKKKEASQPRRTKNE
jgi:YidC/Oxa1 family membrane protein insertase